MTCSCSSFFAHLVPTFCTSFHDILFFSHVIILWCWYLCFICFFVRDHDMTTKTPTTYDSGRATGVRDRRVLKFCSSDTSVELFFFLLFQITGNLEGRFIWVLFFTHIFSIDLSGFLYIVQYDSAAARAATTLPISLSLPIFINN